MAEKLHLVFFEDSVVIISGSVSDEVVTDRRKPGPLTIPLLFHVNDSSITNFDGNGQPFKSDAAGVRSYYQFFSDNESDRQAAADSSAKLRLQIAAHFLPVSGTFNPGASDPVFFDCCFVPLLDDRITDLVADTLSSKHFICERTYPFAATAHAALLYQGLLRQGQAASFIGVYGTVCEFRYIGDDDVLAGMRIHLEMSWEDLAVKRLADLILHAMMNSGGGLGYDPNEDKVSLDQDMSTCIAVARKALPEFRHKRLELAYGSVILLNKESARIVIMRSELESALTGVTFHIRNQFLNFLGTNMPSKVYLIGDFNQAEIFVSNLSSAFLEGVVTKLDLMNLTALLTGEGAKAGAISQKPQPALPPVNVRAEMKRTPLPEPKREKPSRSGPSPIVVVLVLLSIVLFVCFVLWLARRFGKSNPSKPDTTVHITIPVKDTGQKISFQDTIPRRVPKDTMITPPQLNQQIRHVENSDTTLLTNEKRATYWEGELRRHMHDTSDLVVRYSLRQVQKCKDANPELIELMNRQADSAAQFRQIENRNKSEKL